jgi:hypothetical protein
MYLANPACNAGSLLVNAGEPLGCATTMLNNFAAQLDPAQRKTALGISPIGMLGELAVNQVLDHVAAKP